MTIHPEEAIALGIIAACIALTLIFPDAVLYVVSLIGRLA